jgi:hypothetical protein
MKVKAITDGFYGGERKRAGAVFEVKDGTKGKWFEQVSASTPVEKPRAKPAKKQEPTTFSEITKSATPQELEVI